MRRILALGLVLAIFLNPLAAAAQEAQGVVIEHEGKTGIWLGLESHRRILADLGELQGRRTEVLLLAQKNSIREQQLADMRRAVEASVEAQRTATAALAAAVRGKREAEESRDAWHRSRTLWTGVGLITSIALMLTASKLAQ